MTDDRQFNHHPELESHRPGLASTHSHWVVGRAHETSIDLLEILPTGRRWITGLDHSALVEEFSVDVDKSGVEPERMRVLFINDLNFSVKLDTDEDALFEEDTTAQWIRNHLGVSPIFFRAIRFPNAVSDNGLGSFVRRDENGKRIALDGFYRMTNSSSPPYIVWFSHSLVYRQSTYIVFNCTSDCKQLLLLNSYEAGLQPLLRPLATDAFLVRACIFGWQGLIIPHRNNLFTYEQTNLRTSTPSEISDLVEKTHTLSLYFHNISNGLAECQKHIDFFLDVRRRLFKLAPLRAYPNCDEGDENIDTVCESFYFLQSKAEHSVRWAENYRGRTSIRINLFFNIATQMDSRTNLDIAKLTSKISVFTQRDSSSMITMAAVTMFFLPGTFVSALFSMVFFDSTPDINGRPSLLVGTQLWLFFVITIPLTILVFLAWTLWQRRRNLISTRNLDVDTTTEVTRNEKSRAHPLGDRKEG